MANYKFYLTVEREDEVILETTTPTFEMLQEKIGAWERARREEREKLEEQTDITF